MVDQTSTALEKAQMMARIAPAAVRLAPQYLRFQKASLPLTLGSLDLEQSVNRDWLRAASIGECFSIRDRLWNEVLHHWQVPLINDFRVMLTSAIFAASLRSVRPRLPARTDLKSSCLPRLRVWPRWSQHEP